MQHATEEAADANKDYFKLQLELRVLPVPLHDELIILREMNIIQHCLVRLWMALSSKNNKQKFGMISVINNIIINHLAQTSTYPSDNCISNDIYSWKDTGHMLIGKYYIVKCDTYLYWPLPFPCKNHNYSSNTEICLVWFVHENLVYFIKWFCNNIKHVWYTWQYVYMYIWYKSTMSIISISSEAPRGSSWFNWHP